MRPVNLIPPEERPGERRPMRGGPLAYVIVGALAAAVIGVAALAITGNQMSITSLNPTSSDSRVISPTRARLVRWTFSRSFRPAMLLVGQRCLMKRNTGPNTSRVTGLR